MKKMPVHILADIYWLPPHKPESPRIHPRTSFRTVSFFTSDFSSGWTVEAKVSKNSLLNQTDSFSAKLFFYFLDEKRDEIRQLSKNAEVLIMDGFHVAAVCRNLRIPETEIFMDSPWIDS